MVIVVNKKSFSTVSDRTAEDVHLLAFVLWHDNPCLFICMCDATVSLKSGQNKVCY